jgi:hypothetical protein
LLVSGRNTPVQARRGWNRLEIKSVLDHEVVVMT